MKKRVWSRSVLLPPLDPSSPLRTSRAAIVLIAFFSWVSACGDETGPPTTTAPPAEQQALTYAGGEVCASCHAQEARRWRGSHHDLAMQEASGATVLGDFSSSPFEHRGERFEFHQQDGRFFVRTAGADGKPRTFEVAYTFGVEPLQQYLVRSQGGRLQAAGVAWDTRPASEGGQRWFHLHPKQSVPPGDVLHWSGLAGNWNSCRSLYYCRSSYHCWFI